MQLTSTTPLALLLCVLILFLKPQHGLILMFAAMPFGSAAAVNLSGLGSIFVVEITMLSLCLSVMLSGGAAQNVLTVLRPRSAGLPLVLLLLTTGIGAFFLPRISAGTTEVFAVLRQSDGASIVLMPLQPTGTNIGQYIRFILSGAAFFATAMAMLRIGNAQTALRCLIAATGVHIILAVLDLLSPMLGFNLLGIFRNAYVEILDDQILLGVRRLIGGFPEPSSFGLYTIGLYGFWLRIWFRPSRSRISIAFLIALLLLLFRSTSTAAYIGVSMFTLFFFVWESKSLIRSRNSALLYASLIFLLPVFTGLILLIYNLVPPLAEFMQTVVFDKMSSDSGSERMAWNLQALRNFFETSGLGAGIGSVRSSGWPFAVLGSVGVVGMALYLWFLASILFVRIKPVDGYGDTSDILSALQSACAAIFILSCTILPQPNLGLPFFAMAGMIAGLSLAQAKKRRATNITTWTGETPFHA